jgi:hypothetical protein
MSNTWQGEERRSHPRIALAGAVEGALDSVIEAPIVDLSMSGALVDVASALPSGGRCVLRIPTDGVETFEIPAEVVRSYVHGFHKGKDGQPSVRYRAAIRFVDLDARQEAELTRFIEEGVPGAVGSGRPN